MKLQALALLALAALPLTACDSPVTGDEQDLTSVRARSRELKFEGRVYVSPTATNDDILRVVHQQTKTAFGPLRTSDIGVNNRELKGVDPATFVKRNVTVIDTDLAGDKGKQMVEVKYTYVDDAVVPTELEDRSTLPGAVLRPDYQSETQRILKECTANDSEAQEFSDALWYVFEPSVTSCPKAIKAEQSKIDAARTKLADSKTQVAKLEANRLYLPVTFQLGADKTNDGQSFPEYDRLYRGGIKQNKLIISFINGLIDHDGGTDLSQDSGYGEWIDTLDQIVTERPNFKVIAVEDGVDIMSYTLSSGKSVQLGGVKDIVALHNGSGPSGLTSSQKNELEEMVAERVADHWITLEMPAKVKIGTTLTRNIKIQILTYFGHAETTTPFKYAIKNSDVFLYNGHSLIGFGPLDPKNFTESDFPTSYQVLFIDSCVSYNYYEADYIPLKKGGTKNLDLVTNAIEAPSFQSGFALGQFITTLINGKQASWLDLLESAEATGDGMRVVDGELDNKYNPAVKPIVLTVQ
ncbi:MAG TPA: hypothetical protein VL400_17555 [Polyangiaceae bacterium]|nr:hypothetical protein [Polyangiaceae bacterium]